MRLFIFVLTGAVALAAASPLCAEESVPKSDPPREPFALDWWTVDGGGGPAAGGGFELLAAIGQPDAGFAIGENYLLQGGFLPGGNLGVLFVDGFETGTTDRWSATVGSS